MVRAQGMEADFIGREGTPGRKGEEEFFFVQYLK